MSPPAADHPDDFQLVDFALLQHRLMFVVHSVHRQWKVLVSAFLLTVLFAIFLSALSKPRRFAIRSMPFRSLTLHALARSILMLVTPRRALVPAIRPLLCSLDAAAHRLCLA